MNIGKLGGFGLSFRRFAVFAVCSLFGAVSALSAFGSAAEYENYRLSDGTPQSVQLSFYNGPDTRGFAWQSSANTGALWILKGDYGSSDDADFATNQVMTASSTSGDGCYCHKAYVLDLAVGDYSYRVGSADHYAYGSFTVKDPVEPFTALCVTDIQTSNADKIDCWDRTVAAAGTILTTPSAVDTIFSGGDFIGVLGYPDNTEWGVVVDKASSAFADVPWTMVSGNHDTSMYNVSVAENYQHTASGHYGCHSYDVGDVHVATVPYYDSWNSSVGTWLHNDLASCTSKWRIVSMHFGPYTTVDHGCAASSAYVKSVAEICAAGQVDLVLQAHDHGYSKTLPYLWSGSGWAESDSDKAATVNVSPVIRTINSEDYYLNPAGTVYIGYGCAGHRVGEGKSYATTTYKSRGTKIFVDTIKVGANAGQDSSLVPDKQMFGVLRIDGDKLAYDWYLAEPDNTATLFDSLRIYKSSLPVVATPVFDPAGCTFNPSTSVAITCDTDGATIRYTLDGSDPTEMSDAYDGPIAITTTTTVKACAFKADMECSPVASATYTYAEPASVSPTSWGSYEIPFTGAVCALTGVASTTDTVLIFTNGVGTFTLPASAKADILVVGGGAGGVYAKSSVSNKYNGNGGNGGSVVSESDISLPSGTYTVTVGAGGEARTAASNDFVADNPGSASSLGATGFETITAAGGTAWATRDDSGSGTKDKTGAVASDGSSAPNGTSDITGESAVYGVGGKAPLAADVAKTVDGIPADGFGGGGGGSANGGTSAAGNGGVVAVRITWMGAILTPELGEVTVTPQSTAATVDGLIDFLGDGATKCDVYLSLNGGEAEKILSDRSVGAFQYVLHDLAPETEYGYTLSIVNDLDPAQNDSTSGSFTTKAESLLPWSTPVSADWYVGPAGTDASGYGTTREAPFATIAYAVGKASAGQTICVLAGTYEISAKITVSKAVTIIGEAGFENTTVRSVGTGYGCFELSNGPTLKGLTITGGNHSGHGAGVRVKNGTISWCRIIGNTSASNYAQGGAGVSFSSGMGTIDHSIIAGNTYSGGGCGAGIGCSSNGGDSLSGDVLIDTCLIYGNDSGASLGAGIGFRCANHKVTIRNCTITGNSCEGNKGSGAGVFFWGCKTGASLVLVNDIIAGNTRSGSERNLMCLSGFLDGENSSSCIICGSAVTTSEYESAEGMADASVVTALSAKGFMSSAPVFAEAADDDYHLSATSPAIGAGVATPTLVDLENTAYASPRTIGCYEFGGTPPTPVVKYDITVSQPQHGTLGTSVTNGVAAGTSVTVTATPNTGYELVSITTNGTVLAGSTFVMPEEDVTVAATFTLAPTGDVVLPSTSTAAEIQSALDHALPGSTITLEDGTYTLDRTLYVTNAVTLTGYDRDDCILTGDGVNKLLPALLINNVNASVGNVTIANIQGSGNFKSDACGVQVLAGLLTQSRVTGCVATTVNCNNTAGVSLSGTDAMMSNCEIDNNSAATGKIGGVSIHGNGGTMVNCLVRGNSGVNAGGVSVTPDAWKFVKIVNCTIVGNTATAHGGGISINANTGYFWYQNQFYGPQVVNTIIYGNTAPVDPDVYLSFDDTAAENKTGFNCLCATRTYGVNPQTSDPLFVSAAMDDYGLQAASPARDAGDTDKAEEVLGADLSGTFDFYGTDRVLGDHIDIGCAEFLFVPPPVYTLTVPAKTGLVLESVETNGVAVAGTDNEFAIVSGTEVTITFSAADGYRILSGNPVELTVESDVTLSDGEYPVFEQIPTVATPVFSPAAGNISESTEVTISCATAGATIYYTTNGDTPTTSSTEYTAPIEVSATTTIKAIAVKDGMADSPVASASYTFAQPSSADWYVSDSSGRDDGTYDGHSRSAPFKTIAKAVEAAGAGETICVLAGTYEITAQINVNKAVVITGEEGWENTVIRPAQGSSISCVKLSNGAVLRGVTVTGGSAGSGAGVQVKDGTISWCCIIDNTANANYNSGGAGVSFSGGQGTIDHSIIANNTYSGGGYGAGIGACSNGNSGSLAGEVVIDTCLVCHNNNADALGGGIGFRYANAPVTIRNCTITDNLCAGNKGGGAGVFFWACRDGASLVLVNDIISGNSRGGSDKNVMCSDGYIDSGSRSCIVGGTSVSSTDYENTKALRDASIVSAMSSNGFISTAPVFENAAEDDYRLTENSAGVHAGVTYSGIGTDLDGVNFANPPSMGCYEFDGTPPTPVVKAPVFAPAAGDFYPTVDVTITCATDGAAIYYTLDGSVPTDTTGTLYTGAVTIDGTKTVKARAYKDGYDPSSVVSATYTYAMPSVADPAFAPAAGNFYPTVTVTLTCATDGAVIRYTVNGDEPTASSEQYSGPIELDSTTTVKARAFKDGYSASSVVSATYVYHEPPSDPYEEYRLEDGTPQSVMLFCYSDYDSRGFDWQTSEAVSSGKVWLRKGDYVSPDDIKSGTPVNATSVKKSSAWVHKAYVENLEPGLWSYCVGNGDKVVCGQFTVRADDGLTLNALHFSDIQIGDITTAWRWDNTVSAINEVIPTGADFVFYGGDFINGGDKMEYGGVQTNVNDLIQWGVAVDKINGVLSTVPWMMASGNNDVGKKYNEHYNYLVAEDFQLHDDLHIGGHIVEQGGAYIVSLPYYENSKKYGGPLPAAVTNFLVNALSESAAINANWRLVLLHVSPYTTGDHGSESEIDPESIKQLARIFAEYHVDVVLQAHDHTYSRTLPYRWSGCGYTTSETDSEVVNLTPATTNVQGYGEIPFYWNPEGTFYVATGCAGDRLGENWEYAERSSKSLSYASRTYKVVTDTVKVDSPYSNAGDDGSKDVGKSMFTLLHIDGGILTYDWYAVDDDGKPVLYDTLRICKDIDGVVPTKVTLDVDCEQSAKGTHISVPFTVSTNWLATAFGDICPGGVVTDGNRSAVVAALNAPDAVNGLNHVWQDYVLGLAPGSVDGRIWIRAEQTLDAVTLGFRVPAFAKTPGCGFDVKYRLAARSSDDDFDRSGDYAESGSFKVDVSTDQSMERVIDVMFVPVDQTTSCEYVSTVNTAGVYRVSSSKNIELLSVLWAGFSPDGNPAIPSVEYVKSGSLSVGDVLYAYDQANSTYCAWSVQRDGTWAPVDTYLLADGLASYAGSGERIDTLPRGSGVWLERKNASKPIYLYGQVDPSPVTTTLAPGFNLIGSPMGVGLDAAGLQAPSNKGSDGDLVVIPTGATPIRAFYKEEELSWGWNTNQRMELRDENGDPVLHPVTHQPIVGVTPVWTKSGLTVPAGCGFWYYNSGSDPIVLHWSSGN